MKHLMLAFALMCATFTGISQVAPEPKQCKAIIASKHRQCLKQAQPGKDFCKSHDLTLPHCQATTDKHLQCKNPAMSGRNVCHTHQFVKVQ